MSGPMVFLAITVKVWRVRSTKGGPTLLVARMTQVSSCAANSRFKLASRSTPSAGAVSTQALSPTGMPPLLVNLMGKFASELMVNNTESMSSRSGAINSTLILISHTSAGAGRVAGTDGIVGGIRLSSRAARDHAGVGDAV